MFFVTCIFFFSKINLDKSKINFHLTCKVITEANKHLTVDGFFIIRMNDSTHTPSSTDTFNHTCVFDELTNQYLCSPDKEYIYHDQLYSVSIGKLNNLTLPQTLLNKKNGFFEIIIKVFATVNLLFFKESSFYSAPCMAPFP